MHIGDIYENLCMVLDDIMMWITLLYWHWVNTDHIYMRLWIHWWYYYFVHIGEIYVDLCMTLGDIMIWIILWYWNCVYTDHIYQRLWIHWSINIVCILVKFEWKSVWPYVTLWLCKLYDIDIGYTLISEFVLTCVWTELTFMFVYNLMILQICILWWHWNLYGFVCEYRWTWLCEYLDNLVVLLFVWSWVLFWFGEHFVNIWVEYILTIVIDICVVLV